MRARTPFLASLLIATVAAAATTSSFAGDKAKDVTVEGVLVDTKCYGMNSANWVADHMTPRGKMSGCAQACAKMGIPVGVLDGGKDGGKVYILITPSMALSDHMAREVKVKGMKAFDGGLIPEEIFVKNDDGKWEKVDIATMM